MKFITIFGACLCLLALIGCNGDLQVTTKDFTTLEGTSQNPGTRQIQITLNFNKAVNQATVVPRVSFILNGAGDSNASGKITWISTQKLIFTSDKSWPDILGSTNRGFTVTLKSSVAAQDGKLIEQCKTGKQAQEPPGDCVLDFSIPG